MKQVFCDVLVIGGGVAGTAAAVAAARNGARTLLVEKEAYLGGTGYAGMFQYICGLYLNGATLPSETLNPGIARDIEQALLLRSPSRKIGKIGQVHVLPYSRDDLQSVLVSLCDAEKKVTIVRKSTATMVDTVEGEIKTVTVNGTDGKRIIAAARVIDCSGSGAVAALAGAEYDIASPGERQLAGYVLRLKGLQNPDETLSIKVPYHLAQGVKQGILPPSLKFTTFNLGDAFDQGYCKMSLDGEDGPERDERAKKDAAVMLAYLARALPAFKDALIADASPRVLDREGRRVRGDYTLSEEDVLSARKFSDGVVKNAWPIELWDSSNGAVYKYVPRGDYYEIPFRCLTVKGVNNLLCAGRCISVTHAALGSTRVMGACMTLGEQAGRAAAYHIGHGKYPEYVKN